MDNFKEQRMEDRCVQTSNHIFVGCKAEPKVCGANFNDFGVLHTYLEKNRCQCSVWKRFQGNSLNSKALLSINLCQDVYVVMHQAGGKKSVISYVFEQSARMCWKFGHTRCFWIPLCGIYTKPIIHIISRDMMRLRFPASCWANICL